MQNEPKAGKSLGASPLAAQRRLQQHQRRVEASALIMQLCEAVQRVEIFGMIAQSRIVKALRLGQLAALMRA